MQLKVLSRLLGAALFLAAALNLPAQGTAISYQGRLEVSGVPANTNYDFRFAVFNAPANGAMISAYVTNSAVPVSNGLFSVILDFGPGIFNGTSNGSNDWLDISVRTVGAASFTNLAPRQPILPAPYALFAASASNVLGAISSPLISGAYSNTVSFSNSTNTFTGTFSGAFTGNGANLTNLNASQITSGTLADARLTANVALLNANQRFTGTNTFDGAGIYNGTNTFNGIGNYHGTNTFNGPGTYNGVNTFSNFGNSFSGSFFGNGLVGWVPVSGIAQQAVRDHGYMLASPGLTTVTLPASAALSSGDIVRISGAGSGGWLAAENAGQSIIGNFASYGNSSLVMLPGPTANGYGVAASADGVRMYAVGQDITGVSASSDSGHNWSQIGNLSGDYVSVACSANGKIVCAEPYPSGTIIVSTNGGLTWTSTGISGNGTFIALTANGSTLFTGGIACSGNGTYLAKLSSGTITVSTNGGASFTVNVTAPAAGVTCLGASSDCTRLVAGVNGGLLYATSNQGATWTALTTTNLYLTGAWMSPDGGKLAATAITSGLIGGGVFSDSVSPLPNTLSTNSTICGSLGSAVELQYLGNGQFMPVSSTGLLWAN